MVAKLLTVRNNGIKIPGKRRIPSWGTTNPLHRGRHITPVTYVLFDISRLRGPCQCVVFKTCAAGRTSNLLWNLSVDEDPFLVDR